MSLTSLRMRSMRLACSLSTYAGFSRPSWRAGEQSISPISSVRGSSSFSPPERYLSSMQLATKPKIWFSPFRRTAGSRRAP